VAVSLVLVRLIAIAALVLQLMRFFAHGLAEGSFAIGQCGLQHLVEGLQVTVTDANGVSQKSPIVVKTTKLQ